VDNIKLIKAKTWFLITMGIFCLAASVLSAQFNFAIGIFLMYCGAVLFTLGIIYGYLKEYFRVSSLP
jgi:hypothetical protein